MSGSCWLDDAGEAGDRELFARRARRLAGAAPAVPSLEAVLAAADARPEGVRKAAPPSIARGRGVAFAGVAVVAAAWIAALAVVWARPAGAHHGGAGASAGIAGELDASAPQAATGAWAAGGSEQRQGHRLRDENASGAPERETLASMSLAPECIGPQASYALGSWDRGVRACVEPERPGARVASVDGIVSCQRADMSCP